MCILFLAEFVLFYFAAYMPHSEMIHDSVPRAFYKSLSAVFIERAPLSRFTWYVDLYEGRFVSELFLA